MSRPAYKRQPTRGAQPRGAARARGGVSAAASARPGPLLTLSRDPLDAYLTELRGSQPLAREEEVKLAKRLEKAELDGFAAVVASGVTLYEICAQADEQARHAASGTLVRRRPQVDTQSADARRLSTLARLERRHAEISARLAAGMTTAARQRAKLRAERSRNRARRDELLARTSLPRPMVQATIERVARRVARLVEAERVLSEAGPQSKHSYEAQEARRVVREIAAELGTSAASLRRAHRQLLEARQRAEAAATELTTANLRLVVAFARRYAGRGVALSDLIQEGNIGLMRAVDRFDHRAGTKFATYASWWLRQSMQRTVANQGRTVRIPVHVIAARALAARAQHILLGRLGRMPGQQEVADELGVAIEKVRTTLEAGKLEVSLEAPLRADGPMELGEVVADPRAVAPDDAAARDDDRDRARAMLETLPERDRRILCLRFGIGSYRPHTLQEIGDQLGLTRERIRQLEVGALGKLRRIVAADAR